MSDAEDTDTLISDELAKLLISPTSGVGPLWGLTPVYIDIETFISDSVRLGGMTLRQYLAATHLESLAIAIGDDPIEMFYADECGEIPPDGQRITPELISVVRQLCASPQHVIIAHNAGFDTRGLRYLLGCQHPVNTFCTMEGSMGAWPELPGGFSLKNVARRLQLPKALKKLDLDLEALGRLRLKCYKKPVHLGDVREGLADQLVEIAKVGRLKEQGLWDGRAVDIVFINRCLAIYNVRDVDCMRAIYKRIMQRLSPGEQEIAMMTNVARGFHFMVDQQKLDELIIKLDQNAAYAEAAAAEYLTEDQLKDVFNRQDNADGSLKSVRHARLKKVVNDSLANETFDSVSMKKVSPVLLARNPNVRAVLEQTSRVSKMISHKRRSDVFRGVLETDVELGYFRASTGRWSSPGVGKGSKTLNLHNCLSSNSWILTDRGFVPILHLRKGDKLWDGVEFSQFDSVTYEGERTTGRVGLAEITPEHPVWDGTKMTPAGDLTRYQRARVAAVGFSWLMQALHKMPSSAVVLDAEKRLLAWFSTSRSRLAAAAAQIDAGLASMISGLLPNSSSSNGPDITTCATEWTVPLHTRASLGSSRADTALGSAQRGSATSEPSSSIVRPFLDGMTCLSKWIEQTISEDTNPAISDSLAELLTQAIAELLSGRETENSLLTIVGDSVSYTPPSTGVSSEAVFDIRGVGQRARFWCSGTATSNCPKHDKLVAEPVRKLFRMPSHLCLVRADLANVEYRVESYLTKCITGCNMFNVAKGGNIFNDPYSNAWRAMTGTSITKADPIRQVAKSATLGLGYVMSSTGYAKVLLTALADPKSGISETLLRQIILDNGWGMPKGNDVERIVKNIGCSQIVAISAYHIHRSFNAAHPEFSMTARWLVDAVNMVARCGPGAMGREMAAREIDKAYGFTTAPDRNLIGLEIDNDPIPKFPCVRVRCGHWTPTVCWREPHMRINPFDPDSRGPQLTVRKANGSFKPFTPQLSIENVTQSAARNGLCAGLLEFNRRGFRDIIHVHDEVMLITPRNRESILAARDALVDVLGPNHTMPYGWAILIKPDEVSVTESMYEDESDFTVPTAKNGMKGNDRWGKLERNEPGCLDGLP